MDAENQDEWYRKVAANFGPAMARLARTYEADIDERRDLLQDIHLAIWRSFAGFDARCSARTWVFRVAHNTAASHVRRRRRATRTKLLTLEELAQVAGEDHSEQPTEQHLLARLVEIIRTLKEPDAQIMLLYLEELDAAAIGEIVGMSSSAVAVKIHRAKALLANKFGEERGRNE